LLAANGGRRKVGAAPSGPLGSVVFFTPKARLTGQLETLASDYASRRAPGQHWRQRSQPERPTRWPSLANRRRWPIKGDHDGAGSGRRGGASLAQVAARLADGANLDPRAD